MIPYFKKYQLTELEGDENKRSLTNSVLGERAGLRAQHLIEGEEVEEDRDALRVHRLNLMETLNQINEWNEPADLVIMYEVTGFQHENNSRDSFWANYETYREDGWNN